MQEISAQSTKILMSPTSKFLQVGCNGLRGVYACPPQGGHLLLKCFNLGQDKYDLITSAHMTQTQTSAKVTLS